MDEEKLVLVDFDDNEIGSMNKLEVHQKARLHRAFSIVIIHDGKVLIQKRNEEKYHSGGLWANTCCSHPRFGEDINDAIHRRLLEEVGFDCPLKEVFKFTYKADFDNNLSEYELDHVFIGDYYGEYKINPSEVKELKWIEIDELKKDMVENPQNYAAWFIILAPRLFNEILKG